MKPQTLDMTAGKPTRLIIHFALPLMLANVFQQLYTVVDTAIVGKALGVDALAALGAADWLNWMMLGIAQGFTQGFSVRISQKFGEEDWDGLRRFMGQSAMITALLALVCVLVGERPGLVTDKSMSVYLTYKPHTGVSESSRTVVSNIHAQGTPAAEAGAHIAGLIETILKKGASGVALQMEGAL